MAELERLEVIPGQFLDQNNILNPKIGNPKVFDDEANPEEEREQLRKRLNLTSWDNTLENFRVVKGTMEAVKAFKDLVNKADWYMLLLCGGVGCGKTHLCEALSIEFSKQNILCRVNEWAELIREFKREMHSEHSTDYDEHFERIRQQRRLIIDDVGMGSVGSSWEWGELEDIVNYRYRQGLLTVITTNLDITKFPDRVISRFRDITKSRIVLMAAEDYRPKLRTRV